MLVAHADKENVHAIVEGVEDADGVAAGQAENRLDPFLGEDVDKDASGGKLGH